MTREQHYVLPMESIVETMKGLPEMVSLQAQLSPVFGLTEETCLAEVIVGQGALHSCAISTHAGHLLFQHQEALTLLQHCGELEWSLRPGRPPSEALSVHETLFPRQMSPPTRETEGIPHRVMTMTPAQTRTVSAFHKHVFALVNGANPREKIARLLQKSSQEVQQILIDLQKMQLIDF